MSPSRLFILRPVATSLLMVAILLAGFVAYRQLPVSALPEVDYPTIQVTTFYPGASPDVMASSVTAPLERQFGQVPGLQQMTSTSSGGSSVITAIQPEPEHRRRRAGGPTVHQCIGNLSARRSSHTAGVQQSESGRYANPHTGPDFQNASAFAGRRSCGHAPGAEDFAVARRWTGKFERRTAARCAHSSQSYRLAALGLTLETARRTGGGQRESGQG